MVVPAVVVLTIAWFLPTNAQFAAKSLPLDQVPARLDTWIMLHNIRIGFAIVASVFGILAVNRRKAGSHD